MAHEKLSPRQKMIGMMYLVLTAMLALNVSKEAVEAFKKVDKGLTQTIANYVIKNNLIYQEFDRADAENHQKAGKWKTAAYEVKQRADEAFDYIQKIKIEILIKAEGPETPSVIGNEVNLDTLEKRIDDNNIPSEVLIGPNEDGKAYDLKDILNEYRDFLISKLEGKNPSVEKAIRNGIDTRDGKDKDGQPSPWPNYTFHMLPLVAVICILSEYQLNVRNAETEVLNYLFTQIDASSFKFNKIDAIVIPNSNYVTQGSDYEAKIFIAASDSTQQPVITVGDQVLELDETGKATYRVRATSVGTKKWGGVISLKAPDGSTKTYATKEITYVVDVPNVVVSPTAMNVMYAAIANPIDVSVPGFGTDKIRINVINGAYNKEKVKNPKGEDFRGNWAVIPDAAGKDVQIDVSTEDAGRLTKRGTIGFRVKNLPDPIAQLAGKTTGNIEKNTLIAQRGIIATLPDADFYILYNVTGFSVFYTDNLGDHNEESSTWQFTDKQKELLTRLTRGKTLIITNIKAVGPDKKIRELPSITLKII